MKKYLVLFILLFACLSISCVGISTFQTADTLRDGESRVYYGGGYYTSPSLNEMVEEVSIAEDIKVPFVEVGYRRGIKDRLDVGAKLAMIGSAVIDAKYHLIDETDYDISVGGGLGYFSIASGSGEDEVKTTAIDLIVPLYASYKLSSWISPYLSPKVIIRNVKSDDGSKTSPMGGVTLGIMLGENTHFALEGSYLKDFNSDFDMAQFGAAISFK